MRSLIIMISIYVIQVILILVFGHLFRDNKKRFLIAAFLVLFVVMAFRNAALVGNDSATSYYRMFAGIQTAEIPWPNPGLTIVMKMIRSFTSNYQWAIIITALWVCFAYYKLLVRYSENAFISIMWFMGMLFYTFLFSALKQAWAMAFLCFAFDAVLEKKTFRFLILVGLATLFHFPALVFLPAYWIAKLKINRAFPIIMFGTLVVVFIFRTQIVNWMGSLYGGNDQAYNSSVKFFGTKFILMLLILGYAFYHYFNVGKDNLVFSALLYFMGIAAVIQTFCFYNNIFERLADYYYQFSILFMPLILIRDASGSEIVNKANPDQINIARDSSKVITKRRITNYSINNIDISTVLAVVITVFCVWRFISYTGSGGDHLVPFYFFWDGVSTSV